MADTAEKTRAALRNAASDLRRYADRAASGQPLGPEDWRGISQVLARLINATRPERVGDCDPTNPYDPTQVHEPPNGGCH